MRHAHRGSVASQLRDRFGGSKRISTTSAGPGATFEEISRLVDRHAERIVYDELAVIDAARAAAAEGDPS